MLIAQALGEYVAVATLSAMFNDASARFDETIGHLGVVEAVFIAIAALVFWKLLTGHR